MGFCACWLVVRDKSSKVIFPTLELKPTGESVGDLWEEADIAATRLSKQWYLVTFSNVLRYLEKTRPVEVLSVEGAVYLCRLYENINLASVEYWEAGSRVWSVYYDGYEKHGEAALAIEGELPRGVQQIVSAARSNPESLLELPMAIAEKLTGFVPGRMYKKRFRVLLSTAPAHEVLLVEAKGARIGLMKLLKDELAIGIMQARRVLESLPCILASGLDEEDSAALRKKVESLGGSVEVRRLPPTKKKSKL